MPCRIRGTPLSDRSICYVVSAPRPAGHLLHVTARFRGDPLPEPLVVAMPVWTPGSYLVREFARHVESLSARTPEGTAGVRKLRKNAWAIAHGGATEVTVEYDVYAHDLTVRTNHVDDTHVYFNGAATFLRPVSESDGWDGLPCALEVRSPVAGWTVATQLERVAEGSYRAVDFDDLVDSPVSVGPHEVLGFRAAEREHQIAVWGRAPRMDPARLTRDLGRVVDTEVQLFGSAPYDRYTFLLMLSPGGRGGLEHTRSCALLASPDAFETEEGYHDVLALIAHEFFHLWHVKRTRPAGVSPYDYDRENHTRLLWLFEGGTSYYDWLVLRRAELVTVHAYLKHLAAELTRLEDTPGRAMCSLEDASFDAWTRLYRPDENTVNSSVSYYLKGELACALLDLEIRARSGGRRSMDDVMRHLWEHHGRVDRPVPESGVEALFAAATELDLSDVLDACVRTTEPLPFEAALAHAGLGVRRRPGRGASLGVRMRAEPGRAIVASVLRGGAGDRAGLAPGDEILGVDRRRVDDATLRERLKRSRGGEAVTLLVARREALGDYPVTLDDAPPEGMEIAPLADASPAARALALAWLGETAAGLWSGR